MDYKDDNLDISIHSLVKRETDASPDALLSHVISIHSLVKRETSLSQN